jgi:hypothetical protein
MFSLSSIALLCLELPMVMSTNTSGYVTSVGYDEGLKYPVPPIRSPLGSYFESYRNVSVPQGHGVIISFDNFDVLDWQAPCATFLELSTSQGGHVPVVQWRECERQQKYVPPQVYDSVSMLFLRMVVSRIGQAGAGFKMLFSVHPHAMMPKLAGEGLLDCSSGDYASYRHHVHCNLQPECLDARDEKACPYSSAECGPGQVASGNKCFFLMNVPSSDRADLANLDPLYASSFSWNGASDKCRQRGGQPASVTSQRQLDDLMQFWQYGKWQPGRAVLGLKTVWPGQPLFYRRVLGWADKTMVYFEPYAHKGIDTSGTTRGCYVLPMDYFNLMELSCNTLDGSGSGAVFVCEIMNPASHSEEHHLPGVVLSRNASSTVHATLQLTICPTQGHVTHTFLTCDPDGQCGSKWYASTCPLSQSDAPVLSTSTVVTVENFACRDGVTTVHYTLVCDFHSHCPDRSDEDFCRHPDCQGFLCENGQCILSSMRCDGFSNCLDGSDEVDCFIESIFRDLVEPLQFPTVFTLNGQGIFTKTLLGANETCPETHFQCNGVVPYCMPVYTRCNGYYDCLEREDEAGCEDAACPGFYRCRGSPICVHPDHVCDGWPQCPQHDDEWLCEENSCPDGCQCQGLAFVCHKLFATHLYLHLRYLDIQNVSFNFSSRLSVYLIHIKATQCSLTSLPNTQLPNLRILDISENDVQILNFNTLTQFPNLKMLYLRDNPITSIVGMVNRQLYTSNPTNVMNVSETPDNTFNISRLTSLDLSYTQLQHVDGEDLAGLSHLQQLDLSYTQLRSIGPGGFRSLTQLRQLNLKGCPLEDFSLDLFQNLRELTEVVTPNYRLCCQGVLPPLALSECVTDHVALSSCERLLRVRFYSVALICFTLVSVLGNVACVVVRFLKHKESMDSSFSVLVTNLNVANLLMGVYCGILATADHVMRGDYVQSERAWTSSVLCRVAGCLCLLSSHVSAFTIALVTWDRVLDLGVFARSPRGHWRLGKWSARAACVVTWGVGAMLTWLFLWPPGSGWEALSYTGVCVPLPAAVAGPSRYSVVTHAGLRPVLLLLVATGQAWLYRAAHHTQHKAGMLLSKGDPHRLARQFVQVAVTDCACWAVVSCATLWSALGGGVVGQDVNAALAILLQPINAALNPCLYVVSRIMDDRRLVREERLLQHLKKLRLRRHSRLTASVPNNY